MQRLPLAIVLAFGAAGGVALADSAGVVGPNAFSQRDGRGLYYAICAGCHMPDAKGAVGAGAYPALAADPNLASAGFPIYMVLYGRKAMPGFGGLLADAQVAAVVNYIRTQFGNHYKDTVTPAEVKDARQPGYEYFSLD